MKITTLTLAMSFLAAFSFAKADPLKVGDKAPEVSGLTETGAMLNLGTVYKQQPYTLVYFYPRAGTKGCTAQGCSLRDAYEALTKKGVAVVGVSTDTVAAQAKFKEDEHFPFTLIADTDKNVITAFGVPTHAIPVLGTIATRQAFLIKDGKIVWADYKASTAQQADDVLKVLATQGS
jgi:thioredoxin-dependent peroxiredoxin